ncbi:MAG: hypothetical protein HP497_05145 [Nitrospira sp.]|nr:hypothetical protein [Nitrospira sp.]
MMLARSSAIHTLPRMLGLVLVVGTFGCTGTATYIQAKVTDNPLDRVAQQAQEEWSVERVDANTLHLSQFWPIHSVLSLGYSTSHAKLFYVEPDAMLDIQFYFRSNSFLNLFISIYIDADPSPYIGWPLKPTMNGQIDDILKWTGASVIRRYRDFQSEPFPSGGVTASPPQ